MEVASRHASRAAVVTLVGESSGSSAVPLTSHAAAAAAGDASWCLGAVAAAASASASASEVISQVEGGGGGMGGALSGDGPRERRLSPRLRALETSEEFGSPDEEGGVGAPRLTPAASAIVPSEAKTGILEELPAEESVRLRRLPERDDRPCGDGGAPSPSLPPRMVTKRSCGSEFSASTPGACGTHDLLWRPAAADLATTPPRE